MCKRAQSDNKENVRILIVSVFHIAPILFFVWSFVCLFVPLCQCKRVVDYCQISSRVNMTINISADYT